MSVIDAEFLMKSDKTITIKTYWRCLEVIVRQCCKTEREDDIYSFFTLEDQKEVPGTYQGSSEYISKIKCSSIFRFILALDSVRREELIDHSWEGLNIAIEPMSLQGATESNSSTMANTRQVLNIVDVVGFAIALPNSILLSLTNQQGQDILIEIPMTAPSIEKLSLFSMGYDILTKISHDTPPKIYFLEDALKQWRCSGCGNINYMNGETLKALYSIYDKYNRNVNIGAYYDAVQVMKRHGLQCNVCGERSCLSILSKMSSLLQDGYGEAEENTNVNMNSKLYNKSNDCDDKVSHYDYIKYYPSSKRYAQYKRLTLFHLFNKFLNGKNGKNDKNGKNGNNEERKETGNYASLIVLTKLLEQVYGSNTSIKALEMDMGQLLCKLVLSNSFYVALHDGSYLKVLSDIRSKKDKKDDNNDNNKSEKKSKKHDKNDNDNKENKIDEIIKQHNQKIKMKQENDQKRKMNTVAEKWHRFFRNLGKNVKNEIKPTIIDENIRQMFMVPLSKAQRTCFDGGIELLKERFTTVEPCDLLFMGKVLDYQNPLFLDDMKKQQEQEQQQQQQQQHIFMKKEEFSTQTDAVYSGRDDKTKMENDNKGDDGVHIIIAPLSMQITSVKSKQAKSYKTQFLEIISVVPEEINAPLNYDEMESRQVTEDMIINVLQYGLSFTGCDIHLFITRQDKLCNIALAKSFLSVCGSIYNKINIKEIENDISKKNKGDKTEYTFPKMDVTTVNVGSNVSDDIIMASNINSLQVPSQASGNNNMKQENDDNNSGIRSRGSSRGRGASSRHSSRGRMSSRNSRSSERSRSNASSCHSSRSRRGRFRNIRLKSNVKNEDRARSRSNSDEDERTPIESEPRGFARQAQMLQEEAKMMQDKLIEMDQIVHTQVNELLQICDAWVNGNYNNTKKTKQKYFCETARLEKIKSLLTDNNNSFNMDDLCEIQHEMWMIEQRFDHIKKQIEIHEAAIRAYTEELELKGNDMEIELPSETPFNRDKMEEDKKDRSMNISKVSKSELIKQIESKMNEIENLVKSYDKENMVNNNSMCDCDEDEKGGTQGRANKSLKSISNVDNVLMRLKREYNELRYIDKSELVSISQELNEIVDEISDQARDGSSVPCVTNIENLINYLKEKINILKQFCNSFKHHMIDPQFLTKEKDFENYLSHNNVTDQGLSEYIQYYDTFEEKMMANITNCNICRSKYKLLFTDNNDVKTDYYCDCCLKNVWFIFYGCTNECATKYCVDCWKKSKKVEMNALRGIKMENGNEYKEEIDGYYVIKHGMKIYDATYWIESKNNELQEWKENKDCIRQLKQLLNDLCKFKHVFSKGICNDNIKYQNEGMSQIEYIDDDAFIIENIKKLVRIDSINSILVPKDDGDVLCKAKLFYTLQMISKMIKSKQCTKPWVNYECKVDLYKRYKPNEDAESNIAPFLQKN